MLYICGVCATTFVAVVTAMVTLVALWLQSRRPRRTRMSSGTLKILTTKDEVEEGCKKVCEALVAAPVTDDEAECAEHMRGIVVAGHLPFRTLQDAPEVLLQANRHITDSDNGALGTRFTVQYNLYAGSIVALGSDAQRQFLYDTQPKGELGCFAFTEVGAGVLSGAGVETTATYDKDKRAFTIHSPTETSKKYWISQGMFAEHAVILADLIMPDGQNHGPHLFYTRIQRRDASGRMAAVSGVQVTSLPEKTALRGLDNAFIMFDQFQVPREALLSRFSSVDEAGSYHLNLPSGAKRMLDLLISRLLTGRVCLSEYTVSYAQALLRKSWAYASERELWQSRRRPRLPSNKMGDKPLVRDFFTHYSEALAVVASFIASTRGTVGDCIRESSFPKSIIEAVCICKFVGTSFGVDSVSATRKMMNARGVQQESGLGAGSFVCNCTCAAEGDNTIMELKVVGDLVKGGLRAMFPPVLLLRSLFLNGAATRRVALHYVCGIAQALWLQEKAMEDGQLLKDIAWCRAHLLIIDSFARHGAKKHGAENIADMISSYEKILVRFPTPVQA